MHIYSVIKAANRLFVLQRWSHSLKFPVLWFGWLENLAEWSIFRDDFSCCEFKGFSIQHKWSIRVHCQKLEENTCSAALSLQVHGFFLSSFFSFYGKSMPLDLQNRWFSVCECFYVWLTKVGETVTLQYKAFCEMGRTSSKETGKTAIYLSLLKKHVK